MQAEARKKVLEELEPAGAPRFGSRQVLMFLSLIIISLVSLVAYLVSRPHPSPERAMVDQKKITAEDPGSGRIVLPPRRHEQACHRFR